jgi:intergrase/recombinase
METVPQTVNPNVQSLKVMDEYYKLEQQINSKATHLTIDWDGYREYLINLNKSKKEIQNKLGYGKTYYYILETGNAQDLMKVSNGCRVHAMRALSTLSKYTGRYEDWMKIIKKYQLKWKNEDYNSLNTFKNIFGIEEGSEQSIPKMMEWIMTSISKLPKEVGHILLFSTLTGLRPEEAQKAIHLIKTKGDEYVNKDRGILLHYLYPSIFFRTTKKCYISVINKNILDLVKSIAPRDSYYYTVRSAFDKVGMKMNMYYCRKVFATFLRNEGIEPEIIDLLQGRIPNSVFVRHYYRPDPSNFDMIREKLRKLHNLIDA